MEKMSTQCGDIKPPQKEMSQIDRQFDLEGQIIDVLNKEVAELYQKLNPILGSESPEKEPTEDEGVGCELAGKIKSHRLNLEKTARGLRDLRERIQL